MTQPLALIIEDDTDLADIFTLALQAAGFATETLNRGDVALARLADIAPSVVLLDLHLPGADGQQILRRVRADTRLSDTRVIIASADAAMAEALDSETDLVLLKPISYSQLRDLTARLR